MVELKPLSVGTRHSNRQLKIRAAGPAASALVALLVSFSSTAAAYPLATGGFADGTDRAILTFNSGVSEIEGPSLRLPTNGTVTAGSVVIDGRAGYVNSSTVETTTADFLSNTRSDNLSIASGAVAMANYSDVLKFDSSNAFGNASLNGTITAGGRLAIQTGSNGSFVTENITVPAAGWGTLTVLAAVPAGASINFTALYPNGTAALSPVSVGAAVGLDPVATPAIRIRGTLTASPNGSSPSLAWFAVGQQAGDTLIGNGVTRTATNPVWLPDGSVTTTFSTSAFTRHTSNPVLAATASTWYGGYAGYGPVLRVGSEFWMWFSGATCRTCTFHIGRAVSTDLVNWTVDANPLFNGTGNWSVNGVAGPYVLLNPVGSGYLMYFQSSNSTVRGVGLATSDDGVTWTEYSGNPVFRQGASGAWDDYVVGEVAGIDYNASSGLWRMWYAGNRNGQERDQGMANSTDGINWTRYSGNPVLARSGACDSNSAAAGGILFYNGTLYMYYSGNPGSSYRICLATSTTGTSWTKVGIALSPTGSGVEGGDITGPRPFLWNGSLYLFYVGNGGTTSSTCLAYGNWLTASVRGTIDLGARYPVRLGGVTYGADTSGGGTVQVSVRSSPDASTWSTFENVTATGQVSVTAAKRYVEYIAYINGTVGAGPARFGWVLLSYASLATQGRYESGVFSYAETVSGASASAALSSSAGSLAVEFSTDNRTTWTRVANGTFAALPTGSSSLHYALVFESVGYAGPTVEDLTLVAERRSLPTNVTVRLGFAGALIVNAAGPFTTALNVTLPVAEMNAAIQAALAISPSATSVDLPFFVTSSTFGAVELREPRFTVTLKNPLFTTFSPSNPVFRVNENQTAVFGVSATTFPAGIPVNITWMLAGSVQAGAANQTTFSWTPGFFDAGTYTVRCITDNGDFFSNMTWVVTVDNVNRRPVFTLITPPSPLQVSHTATTTFRADAADADLEALSYVWDLDGIPRVGNNNLSLSNLPRGLHNVNVTVTDGLWQTGTSWLVISTNVAPVLLSMDPPGNFSVSHRAHQTISVAAADGDGEPLVYAWTLDGVTQPAAGPQFEWDTLNVGSHLVRLRVLDAYANVTFVWNVTSTNAAPWIRVDAAAPSGGNHSHSGSVNFTITAGDDDGDFVQTSWYVNGGPQGGNNTMLMVKPFGMGPLQVIFYASDYLATSSWVWNGTGVNSPPIISSVFPGDRAALSIVDQANFTVDASDADYDEMSFSWVLDGISGGADYPWFAPGPLASGAHVLRINVWDGVESTALTWTVVASDFPPELRAADPEASVTISHTARITVRVEAFDHEGKMLQYRWFLGASNLVSTRNSTELGPLDVGNYTLAVDVSDGLSTVREEWAVRVTDEPPLVEGLSPAPGAVQGQTFQPVVFTARATDADGDPVVIAWFDGNIPLNGSTAVTVMWPTPGTRTVTLIVSSTGLRQTVTWTVNVASSNAAPTLRDSSPAAEAVAGAVGDTMPFVFTVDDDAVLPLTIEWRVDGVKVGEGTGYVYTPGLADIGRHTVTVVGSDSEYNVTRSWTVDVAATRPVTQSAGGLEVALLLVVVGVGAAAGAFMLGRRRSKHNDRFAPVQDPPQGKAP